MEVDVWTQRTVERLVETCTIPSLVKSLFFPQNWKPQMEPIKVLSLKIAMQERVPLEGSISLQFHLADPHVCMWFDIVKNLEVDLLQKL